MELLHHTEIMCHGCTTPWVSVVLGVTTPAQMCQSMPQAARPRAVTLRNYRDALKPMHQM